MGALERIPHDTALGASLAASEHVQRYRWAASMVRGLRVLDLCCGVGYGAAILREQAAAVVGVDYDAGAIREATGVAARGGLDVSFEVGDAHHWLERDLSADFDAIVCFEGLEHLEDFDGALARLAAQASRGMRLLLSVPNSRTFDEDNEFHLTDLDYEQAREAFSIFPNVAIRYQYVAEGAVILDDDGSAGESAELLVPDRSEPPYANTFLCAVNVGEDELAGAGAHMRFMVAPVLVREMRSIGRANAELWAVNRRLGRQLAEVAEQLEKGELPLSALRRHDTAASSALVKLMVRAERAESLERRLARAEDDAAIGWGRYHELRNRRVVKLAMRLSRMIRGR